MRSRDYLKRIWILMATVFVDMMGFLIVLPLLPFYAEKLGASPFEVGLLISCFAIAQLASAPLWGRLSDRYGRRPMILAGLLVSAVAYTIFESATAVWLLFLSRFVQGGAAGTIGVVQAYVSDAVPREERTKALGWLTAATSAGVMIGPAIGSLTAGGPIGPGYIAAGLCVLNALSALRWLPESSAGAAERAKKKSPPGATRAAIVGVLKHPRGPVGSYVWIYTMGMMAFMAMNGVLALYLERVFGINEKTIGWLFVYVGGISLIMRSLVLGPVIRRFGELPVMRSGALAMGLALLTMPLATSVPQLGLAVLLMPIGTAFLFPTTTSLVSARAPENQTGLLLGVQQSFGGMARMIGPMWAGALFQSSLGIRSPFFIAAGVMLVTLLFAQTVGKDPLAVASVEVPEPGDIETAVPLEPS